MTRPFLIAVLTLLLPVSLAVAARSAPVSERTWEQVINDYFARGLTTADGCAATVVARTHLPPRYKEGTAIVHAFDVHERDVCTGDGDAVNARVGMTDAEVAVKFGAPIPWLSGPRCWHYHASKAGTSIDAMRICFTNGVVTRVQFGEHG